MGEGGRERWGKVEGEGVGIRRGEEGRRGDKRRRQQRENGEEREGRGRGG